MIAKWGKYKAKEADAYIAQLAKETEALRLEYNQKFDEISEENQRLKQRLAELEGKESLIARVMLDATLRAKDIEEDYKQRAHESDMGYEKLRAEWSGHFKASKDNIENIKTEAAAMLTQINEQFEQLSKWSDQKLSELTAGELPKIELTSTHPAYETGSEIPQQTVDLEQEIAKGAGADLKELCEELGLMD